MNLNFYIGIKGENLGKIILYTLSPRSQNDYDINMDEWLICDGQPLTDLMEYNVYHPLVSFLIEKGRSDNYSQKEAHALYKPYEDVEVKPKQDTDLTLNPSYYSCFAIEPIEYITKNNLSFCQGNVVKYVTRYDKKHTTKEGRIEDLKKAISNLERLIVKEN